MNDASVGIQTIMNSTGIASTGAPAEVVATGVVVAETISAIRYADDFSLMTMINTGVVSINAPVIVAVRVVVPGVVRDAVCFDDAVD